MESSIGRGVVTSSSDEEESSDSSENIPPAGSLLDTLNLGIESKFYNQGKVILKYF